ncbi:MAG: zinc ribbon protein [Conexibacter sp.]|nr:zinc ribbon protein [Conexibacter sp.]
MKEQPVIIESTEPVPVFGRDGEPCPACGAPLAGDQRYCLHCGARRPEARLEFLDVLDADVRARSVLPPPGVVAGAAPYAAGYAGPPPPPPRGLNGRLQANAGLLALAALLLLTLLIGLLLGHWATGSNSAPSAAAPAPQVIRVEGTAAPASAGGTSVAGTSGTTSGGSGSSSSSSKSKAKSSTASTKAKVDKDAVSVKSLSSKKAVDDAVKKGKPISTGTGKLPPKDDKAAGGGSSFETIG